MFLTTLWLFFAQVIDVPVIDHARAVEVQPISSNVIMCASADALPGARQLYALHPDDPATDRALQTGRCMQTFSTDPMVADFQEDVDWFSVAKTGKVQRGQLRVVRVRFAVPVPNAQSAEVYFYIAADDLRVGSPRADDADAAAKWCTRNHVRPSECYQGTGGAIPPSGIPDDE